MKKLTSVIVLLVITVSMLLGAGYAVKAADGNKIGVKVDIGFNDNYKVGFFTPITLTVDNKYKDIQGEIEIRVPSVPGKYVSYAKKISMQKDSEKVVTINVPINGQRIKYELLVTNGKETVFSDDISINNTSNNITKFIGILSDDADSLSYINSMPSAQGTTISTKSITLNEKNLPDDFLTLKNFDVIVINNFDTSKLSNIQYDALKQWVKDGGTLLIGTGSGHVKTLGIFKDDFIKGSAGNIKNVSTSKINSMATNGDNNSKVNIPALEINVENSKTNIDEGGVKLVQSVIMGKGAVGLAAFDLGQPPFVGWSNNTNFAAKLLGAINPHLTDISKLNNYPPEQQANMLSGAMNQFNEFASVKTTRFYIIIFIYIIIAVPLNYLVLKKLDKRELMWITVPALGVIFGFIVFMSGFSGRINKVTTNMISTIYVDEEGNMGVSSYAGIFTPKKMQLKLQSKDGSKISNISNQYYGNSAFADNADMEAKVYSEGNGGIEYYNTSILQNKLIQIQQPNIDLGKLETDIKIKDGVLSGNIKNSTKLDLEDCYVLTPSDYYELGDIKAGESKSLSGKTGSYSGNIDQFANEVIMGYGRTFSPKVTYQSDPKKFIDNSQKTSMLRAMFSNSGMVTDGIKVIGFSRTNIQSPLIVNDGIEAAKNERYVLEMSVNPNFMDGDTADYPAGFIPFTVLPASSLKYDIYGRRFFGIGSAEIEYSIDKKVALEEVDIDDSNLTNGGPQPVLYIYNFLDDKYENLKDKALKGESLKRYVNSENKFKIKVELNNGDCTVPKIAARGKVK